MNLDDRTQELDIYLKCIGKFDVPLKKDIEKVSERRHSRRKRGYL